MNVPQGLDPRAQDIVDEINMLCVHLATTSREIAKRMKLLERHTLSET
jgi:hypothetical protein